MNTAFEISGNTAQRLCDRCVVKFFVRWNKKRSEYWMYSRAFLRHMTENSQADGVQSRQTLFVRCYRILLYHEKSGVAIIFFRIFCEIEILSFCENQTKNDVKITANVPNSQTNAVLWQYRAKSPDVLCAVLPYFFLPIKGSILGATKQAMIVSSSWAMLNFD